MNKKIYLLSILLLALVFVSCEETKEVSVYDNWQERNEAFIDSLHNEFMTNREASGLDTIHLLSAPDDYIFYKEKTPVTSEPLNPDNIYEYIEGYISEDIQPYYTDSIYTYYKGTYIIGSRFAGFAGKNPTAFDSPSKFNVSGFVTGMTEILQRMKVGERREIYVPWKYGYGASGYNDILGYTTLVFDLQLHSIINRSSNALSTLDIEE